jgi:recombination protein RecA
VLIIDAEATLDLGRAAILGVDVKKMPKPIVPPNGDVGLQMIYDACMSGAFSVIMLDSVAALNPSEEIVADVAESKNRVGLSGKMMSTALRKIVYAAYISDTAVIFINQLRDKPGVLFGPKEETPGGRALKFAASARIEITPVSGVDNIYLNAEKERIGQKVRMKAVKNKLGAPYREANIDLYYLKPLDAVSELIEIAEIMGIMTSEGRKKKFRGEIVGNNYDEMKILFMTKHDWRAALMEDVENGYAPQSDIEVEKEKELKELLAGDSTIVDQVPETMTEICEEDGEPDQAPSPQSVL